MKKISIVTTTIHKPTFIRQYFENFQKFNMKLENINFIIVGDNKTPKNLVIDRPYNDLSNVEYWKPKDQDEWLNKQFPGKLKKIKRLIIPENDMRRRNFGYLRAIELNSDIVITIDDDNFPIQESNWLEEHIRGLKYSRRKIKSDNQIINPCEFLKTNKLDLYSRGYPLSEYYFSVPIRESGRSKSILNMGLWKNKPDVDSFTNILYPNLYSEGFYGHCWYSLAKDNYFPVNTQNTSFRKELSIFHNLYMNKALFHRFDDIWIGLFTQKLMHKMGDSASFGKPLVEHRRNTHDYVKDLHVEFMGIALNNKMWKTILELNIESKTYRDGFLEIAHTLPIIFNKNILIEKFFIMMKESMELWIELIESL